MTESRRGHRKKFAALFVVATMKYNEVTIKNKARVALSFLDMDLTENMLLREEDTWDLKGSAAVFSGLCI